ncbi:MAG: hypothetical protein H6718_24170 [Polyangiaceae bacterium]|nr:hypothetical protein [Polyangiaceae bacterium]
MQAALALDPQQLEGEPAPACEPAVQVARDALGSGRAALAVVLERVEHVESPFAERVGDAAFMARFAFGQLDAELTRAGTGDRWQVARLVDKVRRELLRGLRNAEVLMCRLLEVPPLSTYHYDEVEIALATRHAYFRLRQGAERTHGADLWSNVRSASNSLSKLCGRDAFQTLRVYDRRTVLKLRQRMRDLFDVNSQGEMDEQEASRVLGEYHNFVEIAQEVNKRPELIEHDRVVLTRLQRDWHGLSYAVVSRELESVKGRDPRLDQALECGLSAEALEEIIDDALSALGGKASAHWVAAADMRIA